MIESNTWAVVELMGHRRMAGRIAEVEFAGTKLLRLDVPTGDGPDELVSQFYGGSAIYCITPTDEATARRVATVSNRPEPIHPWQLEPGSRPEPDDDDDDDDDWRGVP